MRLKDIVVFSFGPVGAAILAFITIPIVAWLYSAEDVGRLTLLQVLMQLSVMVFSLAMHQSYVREYYEVQDKALLLRTTILPGLSFFLVFILIISILPLSLSKTIFEYDSSLVVILLFLGILSNIIVNFLLHMLRMEQKGLLFSLSQISPRFIFLVVLALSAALELPKDFFSLVFATTFSFFVTLLILLFFTFNKWKTIFKWEFNQALFLRMVKFSIPLVAGSIAYWGLTAMDRFYIKALVGLEELGVYAVAVTLASGATVLSMIFSNLWHPIVYKWAKSDFDILKVERVHECVLLLVTFVWSMTGVFSWVILYFLPSGYEAVQYLVVASIAMPLLYMLSETTVIGIGITRKSGYAALASVVAFIANAFLNYLLIPKYGAAGASIASLFAFLLFYILRTELSCLAWKNISRRATYFVLAVYSVLTLTFVLVSGGNIYFQIIWLVVFLLPSLLFKRRLLFLGQKALSLKAKGI